MILNKKAMFDIGLSILLIKLEPGKCWSFETGTFVLTGYFDISASRLTIIWVRSFIHTTYRCVFTCAYTRSYTRAFAIAGLLHPCLFHCTYILVRLTVSSTYRLG